MDGATFAWLTFTANVTNGIYNASTMNFMVDYTKGTDVGDVPVLEGTVFLSSDITPLTVTAKKTSGSADGILSIKLYTATDEGSTAIAAAEILNYAVCVENACVTIENAETYIDTSNGTTGVVDSTGDIVIYSGALQSTDTDYNIYLWIDSESLTNEQTGLTYTGYVHATATQSDAS